MGGVEENRAEHFSVAPSGTSVCSHAFSPLVNVRRGPFIDKQGSVMLQMTHILGTTAL